MGHMEDQAKMARSRRYFTENPEWHRPAMAVVNAWGENMTLQQAIAEALEAAWQAGAAGKRPEFPAEEDEESAGPVTRVVRRRPAPEAATTPKLLTRSRR